MKKKYLIQSGIKAMSAFIFAIILSVGFTACTANDDNPQPEPQPELADYTMVIYGNVGGRMDNLIEDIWAETHLLNYAQVLAEETTDEQLKTIAEELETAFGKAILQQETADMGIRPALKSYSLSVVLLDHDTYNAQVTNTQHTYRQAYEYSYFHQETQWGRWLDMNQQLPTGNPCGQVY